MVPRVLEVKVKMVKVVGTAGMAEAMEMADRVSLEDTQVRTPTVHHSLLPSSWFYPSFNLYFSGCISTSLKRLLYTVLARGYL